MREGRWRELDVRHHEHDDGAAVRHVGLQPARKSAARASSRRARGLPANQSSGDRCRSPPLSLAGSGSDVGVAAKVSVYHFRPFLSTRPVRPCFSVAVSPVLWQAGLGPRGGSSPRPPSPPAASALSAPGPARAGFRRRRPARDSRSWPAGSSGRRTSAPSGVSTADQPAALHVDEVPPGSRPRAGRSPARTALARGGRRAPPRRRGVSQWTQWLLVEVYGSVPPAPKAVGAAHRSRGRRSWPAPSQRCAGTRQEPVRRYCSRTSSSLAHSVKLAGKVAEGRKRCLGSSLL